MYIYLFHKFKTIFKIYGILINKIILFMLM